MPGVTFVQDLGHFVKGRQGRGQTRWSAPTVFDYVVTGVVVPLHVMVFFIQHRAVDSRLHGNDVKMLRE